MTKESNLQQHYYSRSRGAMVARLTPDQKVTCSNHVGIKCMIHFYTISCQFWCGHYEYLLKGKLIKWSKEYKYEVKGNVEF